MKNKILYADPKYRELLKSFTVTDSIVALLYYVLILAVYYLMGLALSRTGKYYGYAANIICVYPIYT